MRLNTASEAISFLRDLETKSAVFCESMAKAYDDEFFLRAVKENKKNIGTIERTYFESITDAFEGCFAFSMDSCDYEIAKPTIVGNYTQDLKTAVEFETRILRFYMDGAAHSQSFITDVARAMERIAKSRGERLKRLEVLLKGAQA